MDAINALVKWLGDVLKSLWTDIVNFLSDFWIGIADTILQSIASTVRSIPVPSFVSDHSIGSIIALLPPDIIYFVALLHLSEPLSLIAAAVAFRMVRKAVTLFQW